MVRFKVIFIFNFRSAYNCYQFNVWSDHLIIKLIVQRTKEKSYILYLDSLFFLLLSWVLFQDHVSMLETLPNGKNGSTNCKKCKRELILQLLFAYSIGAYSIPLAKTSRRRIDWYLTEVEWSSRRREGRDQGQNHAFLIDPKQVKLKLVRFACSLFPCCVYVCLCMFFKRERLWIENCMWLECDSGKGW